MTRHHREKGLHWIQYWPYARNWRRNKLIFSALEDLFLDSPYPGMAKQIFECQWNNIPSWLKRYTTKRVNMSFSFVYMWEALFLYHWRVPHFSNCNVYIAIASHMLFVPDCLIWKISAIYAFNYLYFRNNCKMQFMGKIKL